MLRVERNATDSYTAHLRRILPIALPALMSFATAGTFAAAGVLRVWSFELASKLLILIPCVSSGLWVLWQCSCIVVVNFEPRTLRNWFRALVALQVLCLVSWAAWSANWDLILLVRLPLCLAVADTHFEDCISSALPARFGSSASRVERHRLGGLLATTTSKGCSESHRARKYLLSGRCDQVPPQCP